MACNCGAQSQRVFDSENYFKAYVDGERGTHPLEWKQEGLRVCIGCGEITISVPNVELLELRRCAGESAA
jgi:hypothetical protein